MELKIEKIPSGRHGMDTMKVSGFREAELSMLKGLPHSEAEERLLDMIDERNRKLATCWHNGGGVYGVWFDNEAAYINVGSSCD